MICDKEPYIGYKIYGPYKRKDNRLHIILKKDNERITISYPKYLMELHLGKRLDPYLETIDHIDNNFNNNDLTNLRVIDKPTHTKEDVNRLNNFEQLKCVWCNKEFIGKIKDRCRDKAGPFCSKSCIGKYGKAIQKGEKRFNRQKYKRTYYKLKQK